MHPFLRFKAKVHFLISQKIPPSRPCTCHLATRWVLAGCEVASRYKRAWPEQVACVSCARRCKPDRFDTTSPNFKDIPPVPNLVKMGNAESQPFQNAVDAFTRTTKDRMPDMPAFEKEIGKINVVAEVQPSKLIAIGFDSENPLSFTSRGIDPARHQPRITLAVDACDRHVRFENSPCKPRQPPALTHASPCSEPRLEPGELLTLFHAASPYDRNPEFQTPGPEP